MKMSIDGSIDITRINIFGDEILFFLKLKILSSTFPMIKYHSSKYSRLCTIAETIGDSYFNLLPTIQILGNKNFHSKNNKI